MNLHKTMQATMLLLITGATAVLSADSCQADPQGSSNRNGSAFGMQAPGTLGQGVTTAAPQESTVQPAREVYQTVEQMPEFPGGIRALMQYIQSHLQPPPDFIRKRFQGRVIVRFVVEPDGTITNAEVIKGLYPFCDREAVRVIESMPKWIPGRHNGVAVPVYYLVPVTFKI